MSTQHGKHLIIPLNRPQYVALPEGFLTSLAWREYELELRPSCILEDKATGIRFSGEAEASRKVSYVVTAPESLELQREFGLELARLGLATELPSELLGSALAESIKGVRSPKGKFQLATPLTPNIALLQNLIGIQGAANPPDLGNIIETLFSLGGAESSDMSDSASSLWKSAMEHRLANDLLLKKLDSAVATSLLPGTASPKIQKLPEQNWGGVYSRTPFEWFRSAWQTITSNAWVEALPARVWSDWATTVLRLGFGFGFIWESSWYLALGRTLLGDSAPTWDRLSASVEPSLIWKSSRSGVENRDVASRLKWKTQRGYAVRSLVKDWLESNDGLEKPVNEVLQSMSEDAILREQIAVALNSKLETAKNLWEAVKYSLITRETRGPFTDHYGLLQSKSPRFLIPDPGTEWTAVVASLACPGPNSTTDLGQVTAYLEMLGACPERQDLVELLERAGLARGSADADQGVTVASAY